jgi:hypothetical protein
MEYEQFFNIDEVNSYNCSNEIRLTVICIGIIAILFDCIRSSKLEQRIKRLRTENNTLKGVILQSIDRKLTKTLKNGYDIEHSDDE